MEQEGEEREDREAQPDLGRAVPELVLEVDRDEGDEGAEEEVQAEDRGGARSRLRSPGVGGEAAGVPPRGRPAAGGRGARKRTPGPGPAGAPPSPWLARTRASWSGLAATAYRRRLTASQSSPRFSGSFRPTRSARRPIRRFAGAWTAEEIPTITPTWRRAAFRERADNAS